MWWGARLNRADVAVAAGFVAAALGEAVALHRSSPALLAFLACGAPLLGVLALRRIRPVLPVAVITTFAALGTTVQALFWPEAGDGGGVWLFALMFACYSLGAHGRGRAVPLGGLLPLLAGLAIDLPTMRGWTLLSGIVFLTMFVGILPIVVGRLMRVRRERLTVLEEQRDVIAREQQEQSTAAVLAERLHTNERLQPALFDGLHTIAEQAEGGADAGQIEQTARDLLSRAREEVLALTAPVDLPEPSPPPPVEYLPVLRRAAQRWTVLGAGAIGAGLALESTSALPLAAPAWVALAGSGALGLALACVWRRPLAALVLVWAIAAAFSRGVAPLDGALSGTALALGAAFAVAALSTRRGAVPGLAVCLLGQLVGVGTADPFGEGLMITVCWLGGLALNEASRLVEQGRLNNRLLAGQEAVAQQRAVVEERLRLAREVHDQIGHSLTVVALQAGAARRMADTDPDRAEELRETIAGAARDGLEVMTGQVSTDLDGLLARVRATGVSITADVDDLDDAHPLAAGTRAAAYRTVQEALTNVLRHAPGATTTVTIRRDGHRLHVSVCNGPPTRPGGPAGSGRGLLGLQERVAACAGELRCGARQDGGFEVHAVLPVHSMEGVSR